MVIGHHLILTGYGHWLPNDPRGSLSAGTHTPALARLAQSHFGRRTTQPTKEQLRAFHREARPLLTHEILWFDEPHRHAAAKALTEVIRRERLTCWACAILADHVHVLLRKHRLSGEEISAACKQEIREKLRAMEMVPEDHPVFSADVCDMYKSDPASVRTCIGYIHDNFGKHGLTPVNYPFVTPYNDWPRHRR